MNNPGLAYLISSWSSQRAISWTGVKVYNKYRKVALVDKIHQYLVPASIQKLCVAFNLVQPKIAAGRTSQILKSLVLTVCF